MVVGFGINFFAGLPGLALRGGLNLTKITFTRWAGLFFVTLIVAGSIAGIMVPRGIGLDFANFYDAGQKALSGQIGDLYDPFALIDGQEPLGHMAFFSLPVTSYFYAPFAGFVPYTSLILFKIISTLCIWSALIVLYLHLRKFSEPGTAERTIFFAGFALAALMFQPFWTIYQVGGQTTPLVMLLLIVGLLKFSNRAFWWAAACYVLVILIKPVFAPGLAFLFLFSDNRFRVASVVLSALAALGSFALLGWDVHMTLLQQLAHESGQLATPYYNSNMFGWVEPAFLNLTDYENLSALPGGLKLLTTGLRLAVIGGLVWMLLRLNRTSVAPVAKAHFAFVLSIMIPLILSPVVWAHYLAIFFVPLAHMLAFRREFPSLMLITISGALLFSVFQNLLVVNKIINKIDLDSWAEVFLLTAAKSVTMLLIVAAMLIWSRSYLKTYQNPAWGRKDVS